METHRLGATESFLSGFPDLKDVPEQHHQGWVEIFASVMREWIVATTEDETNMACTGSSS